jgi:hypothetical protein
VTRRPEPTTFDMVAVVSFLAVLTVLMLAVMPLLLAVRLVAAVLGRVVRATRRRRVADLADVLGYTAWSGRVEDLPTIADRDRNVRPGGGR